MRFSLCKAAAFFVSLGFKTITYTSETHTPDSHYIQYGLDGAVLEHLPSSRSRRLPPSEVCDAMEWSVTLASDPIVNATEHRQPCDPTFGFTYNHCLYFFDDFFSNGLGTSTVCDT